MDALAKSFPPGVRYDIPYDTTRFIEVSIREVVQTLGEAMVLVVLVVYLFLQSWRATLIPMVAVPVSLIGTFAGMYVLGFSINTLTLFGMVLCIGLVVDDAIVVVENVERHMEGGLSPKEAAKKAMEEVTGPVIAIVLVLVSVFIPTAFLGGITGQLYRQFAVTIAISVTISGFVALTLSPALCALVLKPNHHNKERFFSTVQPLLRVDAASLHRDGRDEHPAGGTGAWDLRHRDRARHRDVRGAPFGLPARGGPGLFHHHGPASRRCVKAADDGGREQARTVLSRRSGDP